MYRKSKKVQFLEHVQYKKNTFKRYKTKEKGFFSLGEDNAEFPWEESSQKRIDKKSKHIFNNSIQEITNGSNITGTASLNDDIFGDLFVDVPSSKQNASKDANKQKSMENGENRNARSNKRKNDDSSQKMEQIIPNTSSSQLNTPDHSNESRKKRHFKPFETRSLRLGDDGEFYHFSNALKEERLNPELYCIPNHTRQKTMDPDGWRKNCNFIPIDPKKNRLQQLNISSEARIQVASESSEDIDENLKDTLDRGSGDRFSRHRVYAMYSRDAKYRYNGSKSYRQSNDDKDTMNEDVNSSRYGHHVQHQSHHPSRHGRHQVGNIRDRFTLNKSQLRKKIRDSIK